MILLHHRIKEATFFSQCSDLDPPLKVPINNSILCTLVRVFNSDIVKHFFHMIYINWCFFKLQDVKVAENNEGRGEIDFIFLLNFVS